MASRGENLTARVVQDPSILAGKPIVRGTRIAVELVLEHLAAVPDLDDLFSAYPELTVDDVKAVLAFAQSAVEQRQQTERSARAAQV